MLNAAGVIRESLLTSTQIAGFALHSAANSVPAGKVLVVTPHAGTTFAIGGQTGFIGSQVSSGVTIGISKSGNTWSLDTTLSGSSKFFVIVPRGDGSTFDSTDSSVHFQVLLDANRPFNQSSLVAP